MVQENGRTPGCLTSLEAIEEAQRILVSYIEPGPRNERATLEAVLDRCEVIAAIYRLQSGYGLRVVK